MLKCPNPSCRKALPALSRTCTYCQADLGLLVDYVDHLQGAVGRAQHLTRAGKLAEAVWTYLEVLEVDPENGPARRQVSQVAAAVRNFDQARASRKFRDPELETHLPRWFFWKSPLVLALATALGFVAGYLCAISSL